MAGNRRAYEGAMKRAANLAWGKRWARAIDEYKKALTEFPKDVTALTGLGLAYAETQQLEKALASYKQAANLSPDNPEVIQRVGQMFERLAQWPDAGRAYVIAGNAHLRLRNAAQAVELWRKAIVLDPENMEALGSLANAYQRQGEPRLAARHHLIMARVAARGNRTDEAMDHCSVALELDAHNTEGQEMLDALRRGRPLPDGPTARLQPDAEGKRTLDSFVVFDDIEMESAFMSSSKERVSPADVTREKSLAQLADSLFVEDADPRRMQANLLLGQGADFQTRGLVDKAIDAYSSALKMGVDSEAVYFNLGLLYLKRGDWERSIEHLSHSLSDPNYALGAHYAISETFSAWGRTDEALQHLLHVLVLVDSQTIPEGRVEEMEEAYEQLYQDYTAQANLEQVVEAISSFLSQPGWTNHLLQTRKQLDDLAGGDLLIPLAEVITESEAEVTMTALVQISEYIERKMLFTALEECFWAIQKSPYYLPLHLRIADLLIREGRLEEAVEKYVTVAETYRVRGDGHHAEITYRKALELTPMDIGVREKLIRLLLEARRIDQAIEQYMVAADAYYQLAQVGKAIETYNEALNYTSKGDPSRHWEANVLHRMGDIYVQRVDWHQAVKAYQRIKRVGPDDAKARYQLVDLAFKLGQRDQALRELDELIEVCKSSSERSDCLAAVEDIVRARPKELALHMRAAKLYLDIGIRAKAIAELDAVGEIQLESGKMREAIRTIQAIIRLGPKDVRAYRQLLTQLTNQE